MAAQPPAHAGLQQQQLTTADLPQPPTPSGASSDEASSSLALPGPPKAKKPRQRNSQSSSEDDTFNQEDIEAKCKLCNETFTAHRYLFTHLSDTHFLADLDDEVPKHPPWKCPSCSYVGGDARSLRIHYGVRHKIVLKHYAKKLGMNLAVLKQQMKEGRRQAVASTKSGDEAAGPGGASPPKAVRKDGAVAPFKSLAEDKKFPKCKSCNYRYFTRLDLCRHFVDNHLRQALANVIPPGATSCPVCGSQYEKRQSLIRHFIWSHQDLEAMVIKTINLKLSEFAATTRDLEIVKVRTEQQQGIQRETKAEFKVSCFS